ncbi:hypothetical protein JMI89_03605 [Frischella sp. Ac48]|uniref:Uncharacterized protein n=1 Tax=Frischella japonica TaxID=2741544 RepID=A0ABR7QU30_9GAMM|nr:MULTISPECIES: hypothetical protein [Orbaceae]MBC9129726.1 hypothetical protein [Frischella japonica]MBX4132716.1 hypothetical protein [Frischella sp. Ac48]MCX8639011.1 hypothetical protein [Gilliamella sp. B3172]
MIRFQFFYICILLVSFFSFAEDKNLNNILYEFKGYSKKTSSYHSLKDFFADNNQIYDEKNPLNALFDPNTPLLSMVEHRKPYTGEAILFKKLPLDNKLNVYLFAYWDRNDQDSYYNLPSLELQIFDKSNQLISKMIVVDGAQAECSINKRTRIYKNKKFEIIESEYCIDIETDKLMTEQHKVSYYLIDNMGNINFE